MKKPSNATKKQLKSTRHIRLPTTTSAQSRTTSNAITRRLSVFQKTLELRPTSYGYSNLGTTLWTEERIPEAIAAFKEAIELDPKDAPSHHNLGPSFWCISVSKRQLNLTRRQLKSNQTIKQITIICLCHWERRNRWRKPWSFWTKPWVLMAAVHLFRTASPKSPKR